MASPAQLIRRLILAQGLGVTQVAVDPQPNWTVFTAFLPEVPNNAIAVYDTEGKRDGRIMRTGEMVEHPGTQVRVRGTDYAGAWQRSQDIATFLDRQNRTTITIAGDGVYLVQSISRVAPVLSVGPEEVGSLRRFNFTINSTMTYRKGI